MGLLTFSLNLTLDGCVDHQEGIADEETHAFFTRLMDGSGAMLWGRVTYEMMESAWPAIARGDEEAPPSLREWAVKLEAKPKYVVSSTRNDLPWANSHHIAGDLREGVQKLKDATLWAHPCSRPHGRQSLSRKSHGSPMRPPSAKRAQLPRSSCRQVFLP